MPWLAELKLDFMHSNKTLFRENNGQTLLSLCLTASGQGKSRGATGGSTGDRGQSLLHQARQSSWRQVLEPNLLQGMGGEKPLPTSMRVQICRHLRWKQWWQACLAMCLTNCISAAAQLFGGAVLLVKLAAAYLMLREVSESSSCTPSILLM